MTKVSVILTSYNHAQFIGAAIESVLGQTFTDFELLVWDDSSTDTSVSIINGVQDARLILFQSEKSQQVINGINHLITHVASGEYIAIHHSDDIWTSDKLEKQVRYLEENPEIGAVFTDTQVIDREGAFIDDKNNILNCVFSTQNRTRHEWLRYFFCVGNALCHSSVLIRRECYTVCGAYSHGAVGLGDFDMWVRLCMRYEIHILQEKLTLFRFFVDSSNMSGDSASFHSCSRFSYFNILKRYKEISSVDELCTIFTEARKYDRGAQSNVGFILAMTTLQVSPHPFAKIFALEILYDLLEDHKIRQRLFDTYCFDRNSFVALVRKFDPLEGGVLSAMQKQMQVDKNKFEQEISRLLYNIPLLDIVKKRVLFKFSGKNLSS